MPSGSRSSTPRSSPEPDDLFGADFDDPFADSDPFAASEEGSFLPRAVPDERRLPPPDSLERMAQEELDDIARGFRSRLARERERLDAVLDTDYWCVLCFQSMQQLVAFLEATGWRRLGERYIDGLAVARQLGVELPPGPEWPRITHDPLWEEFVFDPTEESGS